MRFDEFWTDEAEAATAEYDARPWPADGRHSGTIKVAEVKDLPFKKSDKNPTGKSLVVKVAIKGCRWVETIIPVQMRSLVEKVLRSARVAGSAGPDDLLDAEVQVETTVGVSAKSGKEFCNVEFLPGPPGIAPTRVERAVAPPSRPSTKPQLAADDDIPF